MGTFLGESIDLSREEPFRVGSLWAEPARRTVLAAGGVERRLEPRVMQVLVALASAKEATVSRATLRARCWGGRTSSEDAIDRVIRLIRRLASEAGEGSFIVETIPRVGYRLLVTAPPAAELQPAAAEAPARGPSRRMLLASAAAGAAAALAGGIYALRNLPGQAERKPIALAILPFEDLGRDPRAKQLARGISRDLRAALSRVAGLDVISDLSSFALADRQLAHQEIGRRLGASLLLQGSVSQSGGALRIGTELVEAERDSVVWTASHRGGLADLFKLQDLVTSAAIQQLEGMIGPERVTERPPMRRRDPVAFRKVLQAEQLIEDSRTLRMTAKEGDALDAADRAFALAKEALGVDRNDVGALLALAVLTRNGWTRQMTAQPLTTGQRAAAAIGFVRAALVSDPNDPAALTALGDHYRRYEWRWGEAENLFRRALAIDPNLPEAHWSYAYMLGTQGRGIEGLAHAEKLFRLDPETAWRRVALPRLLYIAGDRAGALRRYDSELAFAPDNLFLIREVYLIHLSEGDGAGLAGLRANVGRLWQTRPTPAGVTKLASRIEAAEAALSGRPQAFLASVDADVAAFDAPASGPSATQQGRASVDLLYVHALEYAWAGRSDRALDLLERALAARSLYWPATLPYGRAEFPEAVRKDPRYAALWKSDPRLQELIQTRLRSLTSRQMTGTLPDGSRVTGSVT